MLVSLSRPLFGFDPVSVHSHVAQRNSVDEIALDAAPAPDFASTFPGLEMHSAPPAINPVQLDMIGVSAQHRLACRCYLHDPIDKRRVLSRKSQQRLAGSCQLSNIGVE